MIKITEQHNIKCLKCLACPDKIIKIGVFYMCNNCYNEEFKELTEDIKTGGISYGTGIDPNGKGSETYHHWLQIYLNHGMNILSKPQKKALQLLSYVEWKSTYELKVGMNTLKSLVSLGLAESRNDLGAISFPLTGVKYRKKNIKTRVIKRRKK